MMNYLIEQKKDLDDEAKDVESVIHEMSDSSTIWEDSFSQITRAVRSILRKLDLPFSEDIFTETADNREGAEHLREGTNATRPREGTL